MSCRVFESAVDFYTEELGFRLDLIYPADAPRVVELSGYGIGVRLKRSETSEQATGGEWVTGRAGMQYRDLVPGRVGGRFIASHIRIPTGGPVPDYVHHHAIDFQMIYCYRGWVRVVYEEQGPPFVLEAGDCVLQPPHIRHRVLECSDHMEVIEVGSPAEHETHVEHKMKLPTVKVDINRDFDGQRFVRHESSKADWAPGPYDGFEARDAGIGDATNGLASVLVLRPSGTTQSIDINCDAGIVFVFVLHGAMTVQREDQSVQAHVAGDAFVIAPGMRVTIADCSDRLEWLRVFVTREPAIPRR